jgi:hypothetical protein
MPMGATMWNPQICLVPKPPFANYPPMNFETRTKNFEIKSKSNFDCLSLGGHKFASVPNATVNNTHRSVGFITNSPGKIAMVRRRRATV